MSNYDTHDPENTPEDPMMNEWNGEYPGEDDPSNYDPCGDDYDCEDDSWSDGDSLASAGWGMDEDYNGGCDV